MPFRPRAWPALLLVAPLFVGALLASASGEEGAAVALPGVPARVVAPVGWERREERLARGEWRMVLRAPPATTGIGQCEVRVFAVQDVLEPVTVLHHAADEVARTVGCEGFGLTGVGPLRLLGRAGARAEITLQGANERFEGRLRILRAAEDTWALAWGVASVGAQEAVRAAARAFPDTLEPTEPAFFDPLQGRPDPDEVVAHPTGEEPLRRRDLEAAIDAMEAVAGVRLPLPAREEAFLALRAVAAPGPRDGLRTVAGALHEARGRPAEEQATLRLEQGRALLAWLEAKHKGTPTQPVQRIGLLLTLASKPGAGAPPTGLTRADLEHLCDAAAFVARLAVDAPVPDPGDARGAARERIAGGYDALPAEEREALRQVAALAPDLAAAWRAAAAPARLSVRAAAVRLLRPATPATQQALAADPIALRRLLDEAPLAPEGAPARVLAGPPRALAEVLALLPRAAPPK